MDGKTGGAGVRDPALWVAMYRIALGIMWIDMALQKAPWVIGPEGKPYGWLYGYIWKEINHPTFSAYAALLKNFILPHFGFFGFVTFLAEVAIGVSLIVGILVPLVGGLGGTLQQINIALGSYGVPGEWFWLWPLLIGSHVVFMMGRAGRRLGLDGRIARCLEEAGGPQGGLHRLLSWLV